MFLNLIIELINSYAFKYVWLASVKFLFFVYIQGFNSEA